MNVLQIGGYFMLLGDDTPYWGLRDLLPGVDLLQRECCQDWLGAPATRHSVIAENLLWADAVVCDSYGAASFKKLAHDLLASGRWPANKRLKLLVFVVGVPDFWMQQLYGDLWHCPAFVDRARAFQLDDEPVSCDFKDADYLVTIDPKSLDAYSGDRDGHRVTNLYVDSLVPGHLLPTKKHSAIAGHPWVLEQIRRMIAALAA